MTFWYYFHRHQSIDRRAVDCNSPPTGSFLGMRTMSSSEECLLVFDPFLDSARKGLMRSVSLGSLQMGLVSHPCLWWLSTFSSDTVERKENCVLKRRSFRSKGSVCEWHILSRLQKADHARGARELSDA